MRGKKRVAVVVGAVLLAAGTLYTVVLVAQMTCFGAGAHWWAFHAILAEVVAVPHAVLGAALLAWGLTGE